MLTLMSQKHVWRGLLPLVLAFVFLGCSSVPVPLPSSPDWQGGCAVGLGLDATLHGSSTDRWVTWAIDRSGAGRFNLLWPVGYSARFGPRLQVADERGHVVAREGDLIIGACVPQPEDGGAVRVDASDVRPPTSQPGDG